MARIKHVPQLIQTECGLCCIVMLNRYYGNNIDLNDLRDYVKPGRDGVGLSMLCDISSNGKNMSANPIKDLLRHWKQLKNL